MKEVEQIYIFRLRILKQALKENDGLIALKYTDTDTDNFFVTLITFLLSLVFTL